MEALPKATPLTVSPQKSQSPSDSLAPAENPVPPKKKTLLLFFIFLGALLICAGSLGAYALFTKPVPIACTMEARLCPDGSSVGRAGPNCEFASCPTSVLNPIADWKTYQNGKLNFLVKYPANWQVQEIDIPIMNAPYYGSRSLTKIKLYSDETYIQFVAGPIIESTASQTTLKQTDTIHVAGKTAIRKVYSVANQKVETSWILITLDNDIIYKIEALVPNNKLDTIDQILSTYALTGQVTPTLTLNITQPATQSQCRIGGCSGQLCEDRDAEPMMTTCEWRQEYTCYQEYSVCEKQTNGSCGWTQTPQLQECLIKSSTNELQ